MSLSTYLESWTALGATLRQARALLPNPGTLKGPARLLSGPLKGTLDEFEHFLANNEFELALEALVAVAERQETSDECWEMLARAAEMMGDDSAAAECVRRARAARRRIENELKPIVLQAFRDVRAGASTDRVVADPNLDRRFLDRCRTLGAATSDYRLNWVLYNVRKKGLSEEDRAKRSHEIPRERRDLIDFGVELAVCYVQRQHGGVSVDRIVCNPDFAEELEDKAKEVSPGFSSLDYRWVALGLRKRGRKRESGGQVAVPNFQTVARVTSGIVSELPTTGGVYLLEATRPLFINATSNLRRRIEMHLHSGATGLPPWLYEGNGAVLLKVADVPSGKRQAAMLQAIKTLKPDFNYLESAAQAA